MKLFVWVWSGSVLIGCASHAEQPLRTAAVAPPPAAATTAGRPAAAENIETSHVYLLSPGKDAVRVVVSR